MELRVLQYFLAIIREENISRAADVLHVTQSTLSRQMAQLEEELGVQLFVRGKHLQLTDAGVMLRRRAEEVVTLMDKIESEIERQSEVGGTKFDYIRMKLKERWGLFLNVNHPLAKKECIMKNDLLEIPLTVTDRLSLQKELENWMGGDFSRLNIFATHNFITNVVDLVDCGVASALTIEGAVNYFDNRRMVFRSLYPELSMTSVLAWKKYHPNFGAAGKFLEYLKSMQ